MQIEVEKKFLLAGCERRNLLARAIPIGVTILCDIYYDTADWQLTRKDIWLRTRNGVFELKAPLGDNAVTTATRYRETAGDEEVRAALRLTGAGPLHQTLFSLGYASFCYCKTYREKYAHPPFTIDVDSADFGDFRYNLVEIELMVDKPSEMEYAERKIEEFANANGLFRAPGRGKIIEFLYRRRPAHYQALVKAGVVHES